MTMHNPPHPGEFIREVIWSLSVSALASSPKSWLTMQDQFDLWRARRAVDLREVESISFDAV
ncbi:hypothetical protein [Halomonas urumqiensis]|uniref:Uncharacterized protein n=1 Tax=Halomonas urumqiensis TaxID=1684789 RepID=A0A2N7UMQ7_9GAMM|nr:hypothetical protein [Halomonas urumqiensis]PMR81689.1 hypothetical protein C1H70_04660 [Halomonas urumqiensis]PTB02326.1 hypothetical protein C6V82_11640 [Halomonas urumqiensis]GHE21800.1 hypothetical protein GCM10017767_23210 [Halomonas urumqiensis]